MKTRTSRRRNPVAKALRLLKATRIEGARGYNRKREIVNELSRMSRDGWAGARASDYLPLERELRAWEG